MANEITSWTSLGMDWSSASKIDPENPAYVEALRLATIERCRAANISYKPIAYPFYENFANGKKRDLSVVLLLKIEVLINQALASFFIYRTARDTWGNLNHCAFGTWGRDGWNNGGGLFFEQDAVSLNAGLVASLVGVPGQTIAAGFFPRSEATRLWFLRQYRTLNLMKYVKRAIGINASYYPYRYARVGYAVRTDSLNATMNEAVADWQASDFEDFKTSGWIAHDGYSYRLHAWQVGSQVAIIAGEHFAIALYNVIAYPYAINYSDRACNVFFYQNWHSGYVNSGFMPDGRFVITSKIREAKFNQSLNAFYNTSEKTIIGSRIGDIDPPTTEYLAKYEPWTDFHRLYDGKLFSWDPSTKFRSYGWYDHNTEMANAFCGNAVNEEICVGPPGSTTFAILEYDCADGFQFLERAG